MDGDQLQDAFDRIRQRIDVNARGCWIWQGALVKDMYGTIRVGAKIWRTHRVTYTVVKGAIPRGKVIRHTCDDPRCCNPAHLIEGDHEDNSQDTVDRGRHVRRAITAEERTTAVAMRRSGSTKRQIAEALKCNWYTVGRILYASGVDEPGRRGRPKGSRNTRPRVTDEAKAQMRALYAAGNHTQQALAEQFGCDQTYVSLIVRGIK